MGKRVALGGASLGTGTREVTQARSLLLSLCDFIAVFCWTLRRKFHVINIGLSLTDNKKLIINSPESR